MSLQKLFLVLIPLFLLSCNLLNIARNGAEEPTSTLETIEPTQAEATSTVPANPTTTPEDTATPTIEPTATSTVTPQLPAAGPFQAVGVVSEILSGTLVDLEFVSYQGLYLVTQGGVAFFDGQTWAAQLFDETAPEGSGDRIVLGIDDVGRVWAVSADFSQMTYWQDGAWSSPTQGWRIVTEPYFPYWQKMHVDSTGKLWYATTEDVRYYDGSTWTMFAPPQMYMPFFTGEDMIHQFTLSPFPYSEEMWVGQCDWSGPGPFGGEGARWWDGSAWNGAVSPALVGCVSSIAPDFVNNKVWMGVESAVMSYNRETSQWKAATNPPDPASGLRLSSVMDIAIAPDGNPWVTYLTCGGASCSTAALYAMQNEQWFELKAEGKEIYDANVRFDPAWNAYVFTSGAGICQVENDLLVTVAEIEAHHILQDDALNVWFIGGYNGQAEMIWMSTTANQ